MQLFTEGILPLNTYLFSIVNMKTITQWSREKDASRAIGWKCLPTCFGIGSKLAGLVHYNKSIVDQICLLGTYLSTSQYGFKIIYKVRPDGINI